MRQQTSVDNILDWTDRSACGQPDRIAAVDSAGRAIRYRELAAFSYLVQGHLADCGVRPGDRVAVYGRKSIDVLIAFQAILRNGGAYVPIDPGAPAARAVFVLNDCEAAAVFVDEDLADDLRRELRWGGRSPHLLVIPRTPHATHTWRIEALTSRGRYASAPARHHDLAFLLYTSGSTGTPKAVMLTHENVIDFVDWCSGVFDPSERDTFGTHAPLHFSLTVFNLYLAWKHGASVALVDEAAAKSPLMLCPLIERLGITVWFSTPTILSWLAQSGGLESSNLNRLRLVMFAGEPFPIEHLEHFRRQVPHPRYVHVLGSTETHMIAHYELPPELPADVRQLPVGRVATRFRHRIVDDDRTEVQAAGEGELWLAGAGVTPGYWRRPEETGRAFFVDATSQRWYRTGDLVRTTPDGCLIHRGRRDRMVKKRGNRIELAEIEACLSRNPAIKEVAVVAAAHDELGVKVTAIVVPRDGVSATIVGLKAHCAGALPGYMVPDAFAFREELPRTSTGKIDFQQLQATAGDIAGRPRAC